MNKLVIIGKGGHSKVVGEQAELLGYSCHYKTEIDENSLDSVPAFAFVAIGDNIIRRQKQKELKAFGFKIVNIISKWSYISNNVNLGEGIFVAQNCIIQPGSKIEDGVIINTGATVDHDCQVKAFSHIAPGAHLCGNVVIGESSLIGVGTSVIPKVEIGDNCIIAGGSSVTKNIEKNTMYAGNPARFKKELK